ncbi:DUF1918 domain-containing protein [Streptomyces nondiastaticus]|uniref:DUF1918 domain-containing protein n=1 Tax=Streptomyces nondiastaticus TaxID=3154512 RepID=A0ABW6TS53_9ACTN
MATEGDQVRVKGKVGEILEVRGAEGDPPYLVRFPDGHEEVVFPGPDAEIEVRGREE